jgi:hypothetical protein
MTWTVPLTIRPASDGPEDCPMVTVLVRDRYELFVAVPFLIDTGSDFCALPVHLARR